MIAPLFSTESANAEWVINVDGGSRGNPGPAGYGALIRDGAGATVASLSEFIGEATNNVAEYRGLLAALEYASRSKTRRVKIFCDSELVVRQMQGHYRVKSPDLKPLFDQARKLAASFERFSIHHVPREQNSDADRLANLAMDRGRTGGSANLRMATGGAREAGPSPEKDRGSFHATVENGRLRPLAPAPALEEGQEYEVRIRRRGRRPSDP